jgi:hypothetical protein
LCSTCNAEGFCDITPDSGTRCVEHIDYCEEFGSGTCTLAYQDALGDQLAVASVEVTTPNGVTKSDVGPRLAQLDRISSTR